jgi:general secretion pathway protein B
VSFILDALRKSEHERQRSTVPGLSHVPLAGPRRELPAWALVVMGGLGAAAIAMGVAWWLSAHAPAESSPPIVQRTLELPAAPAAAVLSPNVPRAAPPVGAAPSPRPTAQLTLSSEQPSAAAHLAIEPPAPAATEPVRSPEPPARSFSPSTLPSAAALASLGIAVPPLRLELHAYSDRPSDRFVFINGRRYAEGERLAEGPQLITIEPTGAVLSQQGQRFLLAPE